MGTFLRLCGRVYRIGAGGLIDVEIEVFVNHYCNLWRKSLPETPLRLH
jgi:hypothetical protein